MDPNREDRAALVAHATDLAGLGLCAAALAIVEQALESDPENPELLLARASALFAWRRCREASAACRRAAARGFASVDLHLLLGWCCFALGDLDGAEAAMRRAVDVAPADARTYANLAVVQQADKRYEEARTGFERALALDGNDFDAHIGLGNVLLASAELEAAETRFRTALALDDRRAIAWSLLGAAVGRQCRYAEALELFQRAETLAGGVIEDTAIFTNLAIALTESWRNREGLDVYERYLPRYPVVEGHYAYALALLREGRLLEGWGQYEFRWLRSDGRPAEGLVGPAWSGQGLRGKTLLLHAEQGFGDVIQFVRFAPALKALGATVLLRVARPMKSLLLGIAGVDRVLDRDEGIPDYDFYLNLLSLPRILGTSPESIPADVPYIRPDASRVGRWVANLSRDRTPKVGLAWAGNTQHPNDRFRSMQLGQLAAVLRVGGVRFVSLQKGAGSEQATMELLSGVDWVDVGPELADFADTAAVIEQLDLVICVDTAVAHLAGAMGKPVWVMIAQPADFRWLEGREDSPWYPTLRLFRQSRRDDWTDVVERVRAALEARVRAGPALAVEAKPRAAAVPPASLPWTSPVQLNAGHRPGLSAVAETRVGILQYLPDEPIEGDALGWYGEYLQRQLDLLARIVRAGSTVLEASAGVGAHAVFLGRLLGEAGHLFLYESRPVHQQILRQNLAANGVANVTVMRRKLGSVGEEQSVIGGVPTGETLDELQLERLDWLKVGASADALDVLAGASETLWRLRPLLFLAAADERALNGLVQRAGEFGYRCWRMETGLFDAGNFNRRESDLWAGRAALALLAIPEEIDVDIPLDECVEIT